MSTIGERLRATRKQKGLNQAEFGDLSGVTKRTQMLYENDQRSPRADYLVSLDAEGVDVQYILTGRRSVLGSNDSLTAHLVEDGRSLSASTIQPRPGYNVSPVNMYDVEGAAGHGRSLEGEPVESVLYFETEALQQMGLTPSQVAGVKVRGDSMVGTLADGDWVLVNLADRDPRQEGVFFLLVSGERRIKRVQRLAGGALYLISDNEHYKPEMIRPEDMHDVEILGRCEIRIGKIA